MFLNRTGVWKGSKRDELSYVCVPIPLDAKTVGALGVGLLYRKDRAYDQEVQFFGIVGSMIGQALRVHRLVEAERQRLLQENTQLRQELRERHDLRNIVGNSRLMQQVYELVAQVAPGHHRAGARRESGTGKELVAQAIHYNSPRAGKPFVKVSCGALPDTLIESELFGYEPGAFTDARGTKKGRFELAHGGHAVPGRGGRAVARHPGEAAARPAGARGRAAGRREAHQGQRAPGGRHQLGPGGRGGGGHASARTSTTG